MIRLFKISIVLQVLLMTSSRSGGQSLDFDFQTGIGTYSMKGLKNINFNQQGTLPFETGKVSDFPPFLYYRTALSLRFSKYSFGLLNTFQSTGSRLSAKDYSGDYHFDMKVKATSPGVFGEMYITDIARLKFRLSSIIGILFSNLEIKEYFALGSTKYVDDTYKFKAHNYFWEPGFDINYPLGRFSIGTYLGYLIQFGKQSFYTGDNRNNVLYDQTNDEAVGPTWNGLRAGISATWSLKTN